MNTRKCQHFIMALLPSHLCPSGASFSRLLSKAQQGPGWDLSPHTGPSISPYPLQWDPTALEINPRPPQPRISSSSCLSRSLSALTTPIFQFQALSARNTFPSSIYSAHTCPLVLVGRRTFWVLFTRCPSLLGPCKFPHGYLINYDFSPTNLTVNSTQQRFLAQCWRQYKRWYLLNQSIQKSLLAMPEIHKINDAKQVRKATEKLRTGVFKMCFITQIKMFLILFLKNHKVYRYPKVLGFFFQLLLIIIKSFVVDILVQTLPRFFSTKSSIISFLTIKILDCRICQMILH